jgi:uncharacterized protein YjbI with pentapeptide repeats
MLERRKLIDELKSPDNATALRALENARQLGWLAPDMLVLGGLDLSGVDLSGGKLDGAYLFRTRFDKATLRRTSFIECQLHLAWFEGAVMTEADLSRAYCGYTNFRNTDLTQANFERCMLSGCFFNNSTLHGADFSSAVLSGADFEQVDLTHVILDGASLATTMLETSQVTVEQLSKTYMMVGATLPGGERYDGRFRLEGDLYTDRALGVDVTDPQAMADRYDVSLETYLAGQEWADQNLS